jgi:hypothetical protein
MLGKCWRRERVGRGSFYYDITSEELEPLLKVATPLIFQNHRLYLNFIQALGSMRSQARRKGELRIFIGEGECMSSRHTAANKM